MSLVGQLGADAFDVDTPLLTLMAAVEILRWQETINLLSLMISFQSDD